MYTFFYDLWPYVIILSAMRFYTSFLISILLLAGATYFFLPQRGKINRNGDDTAITQSIANVSEPQITMPPIPTPARPYTKNTLPANSTKKMNLKKYEPDCPPTNALYERFQCFRKFYGKIISTDGVNAALADIKSRYDDPFIKSQCHQLMHVIGREAALVYPLVSDAFSHGDGFCWSGYYHGVMEEIVAGYTPEKIAKEADTFCNTISGRKTYSFDYYNCVHGLGHGFMSILHNDLPQSLELCDNLTGFWEQSSCWSGVFMENIIADEINHFAKYLKDDDPHYPCDIVKDQYKGTCYLMQTSRMLALTGENFLKVFELCTQAGEAYRDTCYQSLGRDASGRSISNVERTHDTCLLGRDEREQKNCVIGAVKDFISYYHSDTQAKSLCEALPLTLQDTCFSTAKSYYTLF